MVGALFNEEDWRADGRRRRARSVANVLAAAGVHARYGWTAKKLMVAPIQFQIRWPEGNGDEKPVICGVKLLQVVALPS